MSANTTNGAAKLHSQQNNATRVESEILIDLAAENAQLRAALTQAAGASELRELVTQEMKHRMANLLAVVQAMAHKTFKGADAALAQRFNARLGALANAQKLLIASETAPAKLVDVVRSALAAHLTVDDRWEVAGPAVALDGRRAHALTLALHELATNAFKFGAFSIETGRVEVTWSTVDDRLNFLWREYGGPPVSHPARRGFGTSLITPNLSSAFGGEVELSSKSTGVECRLVAPPLANSAKLGESHHARRRCNRAINLTAWASESPILIEDHTAACRHAETLGI